MELEHKYVSLEVKCYSKQVQEYSLVLCTFFHLHPRAAK